MELKFPIKIVLIMVISSFFISSFPSVHNVFATSYGSDDIDCNSHDSSMGGINHMGGTCQGENGGYVHFGGTQNTNTGAYHFHAGFHPG